MATGYILPKKIICCPECLKKRKTKRFDSVGNLNKHLTVKHNSKYHLKIVGNDTLVIPRTSKKKKALKNCE